MPQPNGPHGNPRFDLDDDADFPTDLTALSDWAATVIDRSVADKSAADVLPNKWDGMKVYTLAEKTLWMWDSGAYLALASDWVAYTPEWRSQFNPQPAIGNGVLQAKWRRSGPHTLQLRLYLQFGSATEGGRGEYAFTLPASLKTAAAIPQTAGSGFANTSVGSFPMIGSFAANSQTFALQAPFDRGTSIYAVIRNTGASLLTGDGRPVLTGAYTFVAGSVLMFSAEIEIQ